MFFIGNAHSAIYPDSDGASGLMIDDKFIYIISFEDNFYFDNLFRSASDGAVLYLNVGFDDEERMAEELVGIFHPDIVVWGDGSIRILAFSMEDHEFTRKSALNYLNTSETLKLTVWNQDWFSTFTVSAQHELKGIYKEKLSDYSAEH
jgi:hypothetical protein